MSKIPEGATHTYSDSGGTTYRRNDSGLWYAYADGDWLIVKNPDHQWYVPIQAEPEWTGEGLPPVGTACEIKGERSWALVRILAHVVDDPRFNPVAIYMPVNDLSAVVGQAVSSRFRPIRTPEQIAAEKRDAAIKEMQRLVGSCNTFPFAELYDYGYRLQVEK